MSGRGRPRQFALDDVVDAALALVEENGIGALSMQSVAKRLGTGSATVYNYVESRDELIDLMLGRVLAEQPEIPQLAGQDWAAALVAYMVDLFRAGVARPAVMQLWHQRPHVHVGAAALAEAELGVLEAVGFSPSRAAEVYRILAAQLLGHLGLAAAIAQRPEVPALPEHSQLRAAQRHLDLLGEERLYESAVRAVVASLAAELTSSTGAS